MKNIFIFGSLNMDLVINSPYLPKQGETMYGNGFMTNPGGKGANQATACGKLGGSCYMGGAVGDDGFGRELLQKLNNCGVNTDAVRVIAEKPTGIAMILVIDNDNRIILDAGANASVTTKDVDTLLEKAGRGDLFLCPLENPVAVIGYALRQAKAKGMYTILNPAPMNREIEGYLQFCDMIVPNETEYELLCGESLDNDGKKLLSIGPREAVVTLGSRGYCRVTEGKTEFYHGLKVNAVDTTAAGDTFCGALAVGMANGESCEQALSFANRAAAFTVTRKGAQQSIPTLDELEAFICK